MGLRFRAGFLHPLFKPLAPCGPAGGDILVRPALRLDGACIVAETKVTGKNGAVTQRIARDLIGRKVGDRIPRVHDYASALRAGNGTIQTAMRVLQAAGAVRLESRGHLGTFIRAIDYTRLWQMAGMGQLACLMPLPGHSRRLEGLATGLRAAFAAAGLPFALVFLRGAANRATALASGHGDMAVMTRLAASAACQDGRGLVEAARLGPDTYLGRPVLLWRQAPLASPYPSGLRVGVDPDAPDQERLARAEFAGAPVQFVPVTYTHLPLRLQRGDIDVAPLAADDVPPGTGLPVTDLTRPEARELAAALTEAVVVVGEDRPELVRLLQGVVDLDLVRGVQAQVVAGTLPPEY